MKPKFSIIIPFKELNSYVIECIEHILKQDFKNFEIILLPDYKINTKFTKSKIYPTGPVKPSLKRNIGVEKSNGEYLAFIDSDAYPRKDWLKNAFKYLKQAEIGILGGPNLIPKNDNIWQKASDDILSSPLGGGMFSFRYKSINHIKEANELPSCNMFIRKSLFRKIGGFDESILTGEDSKLCFQVKKLDKKILYSPDVVVYHHRRSLFKQHLKQIWNYGRDKASVFHHLPLKGRLFYFLPSFFTIGLFSGFFLFFNPWLDLQFFKLIYLILLEIYLIIVILNSLIKNPKTSVLTIPGTILTHITYGVGFLYGLFQRLKF